MGLVRRLRSEPGYLGALLRHRARVLGGNVLLFIDQFEELYTLASATERRAFLACVSGVADDPATPLRVIISIRSDFLDRVAEDRRAIERLTRGLVFLPTPGKEALAEALTAPLELVGYSFESPDLVDDMVQELAATPSAFPLLQFAAARLWDSRDKTAQKLTQAGYDGMGGIAGSLAVHADEVIAVLGGRARKLLRAMFQRLVTPDRTRAVVDLEELLPLGETPDEIRTLVNHLVQARLLVVQTRGEEEGAAVEIVHESLIASWPTLRRWLDEGSEDAAFIAQISAAAKQ
jgi:hypothetical protein